MKKLLLCVLLSVVSVCAAKEVCRDTGQTIVIWLSIDKSMEVPQQVCRIVPDDSDKVAETPQKKSKQKEQKRN